MTLTLRIAAIVLMATLGACSVARSAGNAVGGVAGAVVRENKPNIGPCPRAYSVNDTKRVVNFVDGQERLQSVGFTAEIVSVSSLCTYFDDNPIVADLVMDIGFGRGPAASGDTHTYEMFVAVARVSPAALRRVTEDGQRSPYNLAIVHKETFPVVVRFDRGDDQVYLRERIERITIPRATDTTSGANFEILVGFQVTPEQLAFNQAGKRFTVGSVLAD